jgi:SPP1 family predicted phage head-tail adaptor
MQRDYRYKIDFLHFTKEQDDFGEQTDTWKTFKSGIWASVEPLLGTELFTAFTANSKIEVKFNMRYITGIDNTMRIKYNNDVYEILSVVNVKGLNRELLCYCRMVK